MADQFLETQVPLDLKKQRLTSKHLFIGACVYRSFGTKIFMGTKNNADGHLRLDTRLFVSVSEPRGQAAEEQAENKRC